MENKVRCSIAMATYNGEKYIKEQIDSILINLTEEDEIIISDDGSTDKTIEIIKNYNDKRIKLINGPKKGVKQNFSNAIKNSNGKYIFLSDQDDIWKKNKIEKTLNIFKQNKCSVIVHDAVVVNSNLEVMNESFFNLRNSKKGIIKNIYKNSYIGCCMAFKSDIKKNILPIPNSIEMHDQWIGLIGEIKGNGSIFIEDKLIKYRRHDNNVSMLSPYSIPKRIKNRLILIFKIMFH
ncbi:MAG: glycosyltransferase family 2 protein [Bacilli bacterium]|nr:glycosyltransferase family 2 protein [Bacilli bacterium]